MTKIGILGAGAWGTAVAKVIAEKGNDVLIWSHSKAVLEDVNQRHTNSRYLPDVVLPNNLQACDDINEVVNGKEYLILATPSLYLLDTAKQLLTAPSIREGETAIAVITKGFLPSPKGPRLILETLEDYLPGFYRQSLVYIAGPSHAEEVSRGKVTGLIAASESPKNSIRFRNLLKSPRLLVFSSLDVRGVQVAAAAKNVIAITFGMLDALKNRTTSSGAEDIFGDGTESLLLAAGLNEIQTLGMAMGATHPETFTSISGVGDLDVTCRSVFGRNRRFGREIIEKNILKPFAGLDDIIDRIAEIGYLPEGVVAAKHIKALGEKFKLKMPISTGLYQILNREIEPQEFLNSFLEEMQ
ncbi:glycerol-3-phosphate dehydrogenase [NAD(P)+] (NAD(P)H-dependent glycerol-3-phosphate dehydrogenase) [Treponema primitia ZAS-2]|uniref:Glycerol-3-phosphate dehydrogenase [NAD(P)+] n=1 Tax=Treponema primitia (strain ATCC BAA-887 / DSM 12427 / ZAS-2) TaxID=545694 RepID=F5YKM8_TREPZ|nr:NAD(P)H-dependent glycerol-3-phosphate dehydrogenase [Treponema primitia]AEF84325.1 glycerol-3-phosphate dehydrogenase [NAD(P)+] (NAD(P)H-dependent glycerol-3-phosphate dehydrogenase) [Treponema primitia ZAS-2]